MDDTAITYILPEPRETPTMSLEAAGRCLGISRSAAYRLAAAEQWPTPLIRLGRRILVPTAAMHRLLGIDAA